MTRLFHAYVAQGANGLTKVGLTVAPEQRVKTLHYQFRNKGDQLIRFEACEGIACGMGVELELIHFARANYKRHSGREWFVGCDFSALHALAVSTAARMRHLVGAQPLSPEQVSELREFHARRAEAYRLARADLKKAHAHRRAARNARKASA
jgi:hypothetical protein